MHAPEFPGGLEWLNSVPLTMEQLRGRVVLIDFWTYSCINCLRTLPHLKSWHERYQDHGLTIIGVHTPEFEFEKDRGNVERFVAEQDVRYPVVLDSDYAIWNLYANHWWPRKLLVDHEGRVVFDHAGEGEYDKTEMAIQKALRAIGAENLPAIDSDLGPGGGVCYQATPETYLGFLRAHYGHWVAEDESTTYEDQGHHKKDTPYLAGVWVVQPELAQHGRVTADYQDYLLLPYRSFSVNLVMHTAGEPTTVKVELDGQPVKPEVAGADIQFEGGRSMITVSEPRLYRLINAKDFHEGELKLYSKDGLVQMFAFTFGACAS